MNSYQLLWLDEYCITKDLTTVSIHDIPVNIQDVFKNKYFLSLDNQKFQFWEIKDPNWSIYIVKDKSYFYLVECSWTIIIWLWSFDESSDGNVYVSDTQTLNNLWKFWFFWKRRLEIMNSISKCLSKTFLSSDAIFNHSSATNRRLDLINEWKAETYVDELWKTRYRFIN